MHIAAAECRWATLQPAYRRVLAHANSYRPDKPEALEARLSQAAHGDHFLLFSYSLPAISYARSITTRQKSVLGRLLAVWNYANVASIGQHVCPIS